MNFTWCLVHNPGFSWGYEGGGEYLKGKINEFETLVYKGKGG
jgi:hypothetical protein